MRWDLFCRVIDNFGDIGVCWRLAADLAARGDTVRLWVDDARALAWMAPQGTPRVEVHAWAESAQAEPAEVVVEAFGCDLPEAFVARMAARTAPPHQKNHTAYQNNLQQRRRLAGAGRAIARMPIR